MAMYPAWSKNATEIIYLFVRMTSKAWAQMMYLPQCPKYKAQCLGSCDRFGN